MFLKKRFLFNVQFVIFVMEIAHQIVAVQNTFQNCLICLYYFVLYLSKDAKTSPLETAKADEPTAMPSADNVSTTVLRTRPAAVAQESAGSYLCSMCAQRFQHNSLLLRHETSCSRKTKKIKVYIFV